MDFGREFLDVFGKKIRFVKSKDGTGLGFDAIVSPDDPNTIIVDIDAAGGTAYLLGHELGHSIQHQRPDLYDEFKREILALSGDRNSYTKRLESLGYKGESLDVEFVNDFIGSQMVEPDFWEKLRERNPGVFKRLVDASLEYLKVIGGKINQLHRDVRPHFRDIERARTSLVKMLEAYQRGEMPGTSVRPPTLETSPDNELATTSAPSHPANLETTADPASPPTQTSPTPTWAVQEIATALSQDLPRIRWGGKGGAFDGHWSRSSTTLSRLLPLTIIGHAGGTKASQRINAFTTASDTDLAAIGATPEAVTRFRQSRLAGKGASARALATLIDTLDPDSASARAAVIDLENRAAASRRAAAELQSSGQLPTVVRQDGGWTVHDSANGWEIGRATTPEGAASLVDGQVSLQFETKELHKENRPMSSAPHESAREIGEESGDDESLGERHSKAKGLVEKARENIRRLKKEGAGSEKIAKAYQKLANAKRKLEEAGERRERSKRKAALKIYGPLLAMLASGEAPSRSSELAASEPTVLPEEMQILGSPQEIVLVYDKDGRLHAVNLGTSTGSQLPDGVPDGATVIHQHPGGKGPSDSDLYVVLSRPGMTFRIIRRNEHGQVELLQMRARKRLTEQEARVIAEQYADKSIAGGDTHQARREALSLTMEKYGDSISVSNHIFP
ncbi:hypothetical protein GCM10023212_14790 [Luteolibacter yonseiensis]